jgi:hypothetical protein
MWEKSTWQKYSHVGKQYLAEVFLCRKKVPGRSIPMKEKSTKNT